MHKVILIDDHEIVRDGIKNLVESAGTYEVIGEGTTVNDAISLLDKLAPDILITDISLKESSGLDLTRQVRKRFPELPVMVLSMHDSEDYIRNALDSGARGYLLKDCSKGELFSALDTILSGKIFVGKSVSQILMNRMLNNAEPAAELPKPDSRTPPDQNQNFELTRREVEVLELIYIGMSNKEIAAKMHLSVRTVDAHRYNMLQKLKVRNTAELLNKATRYRLIKPA